jgi:hypothetical protein
LTKTLDWWADSIKDLEFFSEFLHVGEAKVVLHQVCVGHGKPKKLPHPRGRGRWVDQACARARQSRRLRA